MAPQTEDAELVRRVRKGDLVALGLLYKKYKTQAFRAALAITRDPTAADDILQESFLRFYGSVDRVDVTRPLGPWLYRIVVNLSYNWVTRRGRWLAPLESAIGHLKADAKSSPEKVAEQNELQQIVREALNTLGFEHRVVLVLFYLGGLSLKEVAYILSLPEGTVKSRLYYGRERLRARLEKDSRIPRGMVYEYP
jgi:RNA polymerase sigma-70 factor (ECF subfamily)